MSKFLRFFFWLIFIVAAAMLTLAFVEPNDVTVSRSIMIRAAKEPVFEQIVKFRNWNNWGILHQQDSSVKITFSGEDGTVGSSYHWVGDEHLTGEGEMKNEAVDGTTMRYSFNVIKPGEMLADVTIAATDTANQTKVTWTFHKHFPFLANVVLVVFDLDKYIGRDFEQGLNNLKQYVEKSTVYKLPVSVKEIDYPGHLFAGVRQSINMGTITSFVGEHNSELVKGLGMKVNGVLTGMFYSWDTSTHTTELMVAYPVSDSSARLPDISYVYLPPAKSYTLVYRGGYAGIGAAYAVLDKYLATKGKSGALRIEEYPVGPLQEPDSSKWITNIYYLVQ